MDEQSRLDSVSAAIDAEEPEREDLTDAERRFRDDALDLRRALRDSDAAIRPPDLTGHILEGVDASGRARRRRETVLSAAAVFALAGLATLFLLRPGGPAAPLPADADVGERVLEAQRDVEALDARVELIERGVHPAVPERRLEGVLRYRAPEQLWLELRELSPAAGWPANDLDLVLDEGTTWRRGLVGCPVGSQPACLRPRTQATTGLAPFADGAMSPLDLVMPVHAFLPEIATDAVQEGHLIVVDTTVARLDQLVAGLASAGAIRGLHPTDHARLELDASSLTLRRLSVSAADNLARSNWAATNAYRDSPGDTVLDLRLDPVELEPLAALAPPPVGTSSIDAGFTPRDVVVDWPLPSGFSLYRTGRIDAGGPRTDVIALSDGRAWIRIDQTDEWDRPGVFGALEAPVREIQVGDGVGYLDLRGTKLALHTAERDVVITGSVSVELLVEVGASMVDGVAVDPSRVHGAADAVPPGRLVPPGEHVVARQGTAVLIGVSGPGRTGLTIKQQPAVDLPLPSGSDLFETQIRGRPARYDPLASAVTWIEGGWLIELRSEALDLEALARAADGLVTR